MFSLRRKRDINSLVIELEKRDPPPVGVLIEDTCVNGVGGSNGAGHDTGSYFVHITEKKYRISIVCPEDYPVSPPTIILYGNLLKRKTHVNSVWINSKSNNGKKVPLTEIWNPVKDTLITLYQKWCEEEKI